MLCLNFNPRAPCGARPNVVISGKLIQSISIHAPRAGRDCRYSVFCRSTFDFNPRAPCGARPIADRIRSMTDNISIHAPRAGRDTRCNDCRAYNKPFQSTRPVRGATINSPEFWRQKFSISIHAPRAGRDSKSIQNYFTHFCDKRQFLDNFTQNAAF